MVVSIGERIPENAQLWTISEEKVERRNPRDIEKVKIVAISRNIIKAPASVVLTNRMLNSTSTERVGME